MQSLIGKISVYFSIQVKEPYQLFTVLIPVPLNYLFLQQEQPVSVASVHADFEAIPVSLKARFCLPAGTEASVVVFTDTEPLVDTDVLEPRMFPQSEFSEGIGGKTFQTFERVVARTTATWRAADGSKPSTRGVTIPAHLALALLSTASVTDTPEFRIHHQK